MRFSVEIDPRSGFCNGVVRAVEKAESYLRQGERFYSLGAIVHNSVELERLKAKGLEIISAEELETLHDKSVLIRAHGEPPRTYHTAEKNNLKIIDCTCPVVLQLQKKVREVYQRIAPHDGQVVIFGKTGHAEVNGLVGQTDGRAIVVDSIETAAEKIDFTRPVALFSQTTKGAAEYAAIADFIRQRSTRVEVFDSICKQVSQRYEHLRQFAADHSAVIFVSGRESSNGKVLFDLCRSVNPRCYRIENVSQIDISVFRDGDNVGICGATSTPKWQLEEIFVYLRDLTAQ